MNLCQRKPSVRSALGKHPLPLMTSLVLALFLWSCSSGGGSGKKEEPKDPDGTPSTGEAEAIPEEVPFPPWKGAWDSDVADEKIKPCAPGQAFAAGKCFDEVHFTNGSISLTRPGETFTFVEVGRPLSRFILDNYTFSEKWDESFILINERIVNMRINAGLYYRYWFLPERIKVSATHDPRDLSSSVFEGAEFPLSSDNGGVLVDANGYPQPHYFRGSIHVCAHKVALPLIQMDVEANCNTSIGSSGDFQFKSTLGDVLLEFESMKTTLARRQADWIEVGDTYGLR